MSVSKKIDAIEAKILALKKEQENLKQKRQNEISKLFSKIDLTEVGNEILLGAFNEIHRAFSQKDAKKLEAWQEAGKKFRGPYHKSKPTNKPKTHQD